VWIEQERNRNKKRKEKKEINEKKYEQQYFRGQ